MNYGGIYKFSLADGVGCRLVLFISGCDHQCKNCQNQKLWNEKSGKLFTENIYNIICEQLKRPELDGITLSGGDPLYKNNRKDVLELVKNLKNQFPSKTIWLYTGYKWEQIKDIEIMKYIDVIVDGKFEEDKKDITLAFRGSKNQRIIDVQKSLKSNKIVELNY